MSKNCFNISVANHRFSVMSADASLLDIIGQLKEFV